MILYQIKSDIQTSSYPGSFLERWPWHRVWEKIAWVRGWYTNSFTFEISFVFSSWIINEFHSFRAANYCRTSDNVRLNLANVRAKVILIGHWSDHKKNVTYILLLWQNPIANSLNLHFAIKFKRHSSILLNVALEWLYILVSWLIYILWRIHICPTKFSGVGFCPTKFKLCPTKIKSDRTFVLSSQIFICSPAVLLKTRIYNI
jgi:hypothetical protein